MASSISYKVYEKYSNSYNGPKSTSSVLTRAITTTSTKIAKINSAINNGTNIRKRNIIVARKGSSQNEVI